MRIALNILVTDIIRGHHQIIRIPLSNPSLSRMQMPFYLLVIILLFLIHMPLLPMAAFVDNHLSLDFVLEFSSLSRRGYRSLSSPHKGLVLRSLQDLS